MKTIKVTYTVKPEFVSQNKKNVAAFINDLAEKRDRSLRYMAFLGKDGKTFTHLALYENDDAQKTLFDLPSFKLFQKQRDESGLEVSPQIEEINLVAASFNFFL